MKTFVFYFSFLSLFLHTYVINTPIFSNFNKYVAENIHGTYASEYKI